MQIFFALESLQQFTSANHPNSLEPDFGTAVGRRQKPVLLVKTDPGSNDWSKSDLTLSPFSAAVFDLDGLLFNTEELYQDVGSELLRRRGHEFGPELLHAMMGRPGRIALQMMIDYHNLGDTVETLAKESAEIFPAILDERLAFMPGVPELLAALERSGIPKAVGTSSGLRFTRDVLGRFNLEPRFQFLLTAEDVIDGKPHPEIYLKAAARFGLQPSQIVVFEDSQNGCRAAVTAGATVVAVPGDHSRQHEFAGAALVADTLTDPHIYELLSIPSPFGRGLR